MKRSLILLNIFLFLLVSCSAKTLPYEENQHLKILEDKINLENSSETVISTNSITPVDIEVTNIPTTETPIIEVSEVSNLEKDSEKSFSEVMTEVKEFTTPCVILILCIALLVFTTMYYFLIIRHSNDAGV